MRSALLATLTLLALAGPALADDVATLSADATHTLRVRVFTDEAGAPGVEILLDGAPLLP